MLTTPMTPTFRANLRSPYPSTTQSNRNTTLRASPTPMSSIPRIVWFKTSMKEGMLPNVFAKRRVTKTMTNTKTHITITITITITMSNL